MFRHVDSFSIEWLEEVAADGAATCHLTSLFTRCFFFLYSYVACFHELTILSLSLCIFSPFISLSPCYVSCCVKKQPSEEVGRVAERRIAAHRLAPRNPHLLHASIATHLNCGRTRGTQTPLPVMVLHLPRAHKAH